MCSVVLARDLSAAFDMIKSHHSVDRLRYWVEISGMALQWSSYLLNGRFCVSVNNYVSAISFDKYSVPEGSVLGPILFCLYMLPLGQIIHRRGVSFQGKDFVMAWEGT